MTDTPCDLCLRVFVPKVLALELAGRTGTPHYSFIRQLVDACHSADGDHDEALAIVRQCLATVPDCCAIAPRPTKQRTR
jgi:hypothetical protein